LRNHLDKPTLYRAQRNVLRNRKQRDQESIAEYLAALRRIAAKCNFKNNEEFEDQMIDAFIWGLKDARTREKLFDTKDLKELKTAQEIAQSRETAERENKCFIALEKGEDIEVDKIHHKFGNWNFGAKKENRNINKNGRTRESHSSSTRQNDKRCFRCDGHHDPTKCKFMKEKCRFCGKIGHIQRMCYAKNR